MLAEGLALGDTVAPTVQSPLVKYCCWSVAWLDFYHSPLFALWPWDLLGLHLAWASGNSSLILLGS